MPGIRSVMQSPITIAKLVQDPGSLDWTLKEGVLALQLHAGYTMDIQFKDVKIKFLDEKKQ